MELACDTKQKNSNPIDNAIRTGQLILAKAAKNTKAVMDTLTFTERMIAGSLARGIAQATLHPIDVMRTRLQVRNLSSKQPLLKIFFKGIIPQITLAFPAGAVQFVVFEWSKARLAEFNQEQGKDDPANLSGIQTFLAGSFCSLAAAIIRVPQEVLKQRIQADIYPDVFLALPSLLKESGPTGLYKGWLATISRDVPWNGLSFLFHAQLKNAFKAAKKRDPSNQENLFLGGVAGAIAAVIMTPIDVVKTRLMTQTASSAIQYTGIVGTLQTIVREEGAATLMKGVVPRVLYLAPLAGVTFSIYEAIAKIMMAKKNKTKVSNARDSSKSLRTNRVLAHSTKQSKTTLTRNPHFGQSHLSRHAFATKSLLIA